MRFLPPTIPIWRRNELNTVIKDFVLFDEQNNNIENLNIEHK